MLMSDYGNLLDVMYASILCNELGVLIRQARVMKQKYEIAVKLPYEETIVEDVYIMAEECVKFSKEEWDFFETSWDFKKHPLV